MNRPLKTILGSLAAGTLLFLSAAPAGATTAETPSVSGGTLSINTSPVTGPFSLDGTGGPCPAGPAGSIGINVSGASPWTTAVTSVNLGPSSFTQAGKTYFINVTKASGGTHTGSIGAAPGYAISQSTRLDAKIYAETATGSCTPSTTVYCSANVNFGTSNPLTGSLTGGSITGDNVSAGAVAKLSGSGPVATGTCGADFAAINGKTLTLTDLLLTFT